MRTIVSTVAAFVVLVLVAACAGAPVSPPVTPNPSVVPRLAAPSTESVVTSSTEPSAGPSEGEVASRETSPPAAEDEPVRRRAADRALVPPEPALPVIRAPEPAPAPPMSVARVVSGEAVYYDAKGRGSCALAFRRDAAVLAASPDIYYGMQRCGACLEVTGPRGTEVVQVVDRCAGCPEGRVVVNKPAFDRIAGKDVGRAAITWEEVPCPVDGNLAFRFKETSSQYWTAIQVRNHRLGVRTMAFQRGGQWVEMTRSADNYFVAAKGVGKGAVTLRVTATDGQQVEETIQVWKDGQTYRGSVQFN